MILHIPHASENIPVDMREQFILNDEELEQEQLRLKDAFTDKLFAHPNAETVIFPYSRLLVDVERFADDEQEPMSKVGMGRFYMKTTGGRTLRRELTDEETVELDRLYAAHHQKLTDTVESELHDNGKALLIDCHSFPGIPLPCDQDQTQPRPDFCIGTDGFHTPAGLTALLRSEFEVNGFSTAVNRPYSGTLVPLEYYGKESRVHSIMIEVNRSLYMDEKTGAKNARFEQTAYMITKILDRLEGE